MADETINHVNRFVAYFQDTEMWIALGIKLTGVVLIIVALYAATRILTSMVQRVFTLRKIHEDNIVAQRQNETLLKLAQNTIRYVIGLIMILTVLGQFGGQYRWFDRIGRGRGSRHLVRCPKLGQRRHHGRIHYF
ncbi:transporter, small conductance mechanosensitive ion channel family protein [Exiguobacterium sp. S17]|nr:transporter, small conductance mechanosensitive ion channel family protein [Exiguobacterium sp. S17]